MKHKHAVVQRKTQFINNPATYYEKLTSEC